MAVLSGLLLFGAANMAGDVPARVQRAGSAQQVHQVIDALRQPLVLLEHGELGDHPLHRHEYPPARLQDSVYELQQLTQRYRQIAGYNPGVLEHARHFADTLGDWISAESLERRATPEGQRPAEAARADTHRLLHALEELRRGEELVYGDIEQGHAATQLLQWSGAGLIAYLFLLTAFIQYTRRLELRRSFQEVEQAHRSLAESEARLAEAQEVAQIGSWELDVQTGKLRWSPQIYRIFELDPDTATVSYQAFLAAIHPADREAVHEAYRRSLAERTPYSIEHRLLLPGGHIKYVAECGRTDYDAAGQPLRSVGTVQDISARRQAEAALSQSASEWSYAMDYFQDAIHLVDLDDRVVRANQALCRLTGLSAQQIIGRDVVSLIHPQGEAVPCPVCAARRARRDAVVTLEADDPNNPVGRPIEVTVRIIRARDGEPLSVLTAIHDLSEQRKIQNELRRHRDDLEGLVAERTRALQRQAQIIDQIHDAVVSTDLEGVVTSWNKGAERLFGYTAAEAMGGHIALVYPEDQRDFLDKGVIAPLRARGRHETEVRLRRKDGIDFDALLSLSLLYDDCGAPSGMIGYSMDITARKQAEAALREQKDALTLANQELEAFSYSVSHDLRAPLRAIDGFSQVLLEDYYPQLDEAGRDHLMRVRRAAQRMASLIDQLLELARLGRRELRKAAVDLSALAGAAVQELAEADPGRTVQATIQPSLNAWGDPQLLSIVLDNLLSNAWKYTGNASQPRIEFGAVTRDGQTVYHVRDNGVGFDMRYAERLFGPFQRLHGSEFEGSGIGLATVQRIVKRHGGRVWAEARPEQGATFFFTLSGQAALRGASRQKNPEALVSLPDLS